MHIPPGIVCKSLQRMKKKIAILASGEGTNAENIIRYFQKNEVVSIGLVICNRKEAGVYARVEKYEVPTLYLSKAAFSESGRLLQVLREKEIDFIVLAGFLLFVPEDVLKAYDRKIINIHPSLLPRHGGKGMYGHRVHEAVVAAGEKESGITVHYVNECYDEGEIISQIRVSVTPEDTPHDVACKVHRLEYENYPKIIENLLCENE